MKIRICDICGTKISIMETLFRIRIYEYSWILCKRHDICKGCYYKMKLYIRNQVGE